MNSAGIDYLALTLLRGSEMSMARSLHHLSYHDHGLRGVSGAMTVLRELSNNPFATQLTLAHNQLGDEGVETLVSGILHLRKSGRSISPLKEVNLSSNGITDKGLIAIVRYLLLPSEPPQSQLPTVQELILSNNDISLSGATPHVLSTALSHPACSLITLSLNTNPRIASSPDNLQALFRNLEPTSLLELQLNACALEPTDARTIGQWLAEPHKGGKLAGIQLNANAFGNDSLGTNRLAKVVYAGLNTSLIRMELAANERNTAVFDEDGIELPPSEALQSDTHPKGDEPDNFLLGDDIPFAEVKDLLTKALRRNHLLRQATQSTAIRLLPAARILLHAKPPSISAEEIQKQVASDWTQYIWQALPSSSGINEAKPSTNYTFDSAITATGVSGLSPIFKLPPEIVRHILRCYSALEPIPLPPSPRSAKAFNPGQPLEPVFVSALSEQQFVRILSLAQDRSTLSGYTARYDGRSNGSKGSNGHGRASLSDPNSYLRFVKCEAFERENA